MWTCKNRELGRLATHERMVARGSSAIAKAPKAAIHVGAHLKERS